MAALSSSPTGAPAKSRDVLECEAIIAEMRERGITPTGSNFLRAALERGIAERLALRCADALDRKPRGTGR